MIVLQPVFAAVAVALSSAAFAQHAHEHGIADLRVAVDGGTVLVEFDSPLANLVGFEHAPRDAAQREALAALAERLEHPEPLLAFPAAAGCERVATEVELPGVDHGHAHHDHKHDHKHDHDHAHGDEHADAWAAWEYRCADIGALDGLDVRVIEAFPAIRSLRVEVAGPRGQASQRISAARERVSL